MKPQIEKYIDPFNTELEPSIFNLRLISRAGGMRDVGRKEKYRYVKRPRPVQLTTSALNISVPIRTVTLPSRRLNTR